MSQLLQKLRTDLHLSFHSFLKEFVAEPNDGVRFFKSYYYPTIYYLVKEPNDGVRFSKSYIHPLSGSVESDQIYNLAKEPNDRVRSLFYEISKACIYSLYGSVESDYSISGIRVAPCC